MEVILHKISIRVFMPIPPKSRIHGFVEIHQPMCSVADYSSPGPSLDVIRASLGAAGILNHPLRRQRILLGELAGSAGATSVDAYSMCSGT